MKLWLDADAAPRDVKDICLRAAERLRIDTVLVANQRVLCRPGYARVTAVRVDGGPDVADRYIVEHAAAGDVAVTADIPLAALLVPRGVSVIDPRGEEYTSESVGRAPVRARLHGRAPRGGRGDRRPRRVRPAREAGVRQRAGPGAHARAPREEGIGAG
jgi:uncharacterized protein YaiI (UPF0178 family)